MVAMNWFCTTSLFAYHYTLCSFVTFYSLHSQDAIINYMLVYSAAKYKTKICWLFHKNKMTLIGLRDLQYVYR